MDLPKGSIKSNLEIRIWILELAIAAKRWQPVSYFKDKLQGSFDSAFATRIARSASIKRADKSTMTLEEGIASAEKNYVGKNLFDLCRTKNPSIDFRGETGDKTYRINEFGKRNLLFLKQELKSPRRHFRKRPPAVNVSKIDLPEVGLDDSES
jgi:hypothetical protein